VAKLQEGDEEDAEDEVAEEAAPEEEEEARSGTHGIGSAIKYIIYHYMGSSINRDTPK
jgi:hypothetical protein